MSYDPFRERETEKYENPIPSREFIIAYLDKREKPANREELVQELEINGEEQTEALRRRLRAMERDGQLVFTRRQCYALPERLDLLKGKVIGHRDGFGFLRIEGSKDDLYLSAEQMKMCIHGDIILAQAIDADRRGRREARFVRVIEPRNPQIVARYFMDSGVSFVVPDDNRLSFDILIPSKVMTEALIGHVVVVELTQRPTRHSKAIGKVIEVLGNNMGTNMAIDMALRTHEIPYVWSETLKKQIANLSNDVPEEAKKGRVDLRDLPLITIDGEDARDFDDAIFCQRKRGGGWRLWIAIADVSYYVRPSSPLDDEACKRGTSIYFPSQVVPMLPEILSNNLCSLNPEVDRLCIVCEMTISSTGKLTGYKHYEAVINSFARLTYNEAWDILQGNQKLRQQYKMLTKDIEELHRMYLVLEKTREQRGGISFEMKEAKFIFNTDRRIERVEQVSRNDAHKMIEECMILANIASARYVEKNNEPALFRDHDHPSNDSINGFRSVLKELGLTLSGGDKPQPLDYSKLLSQIVSRPDCEMLQTMLLRSMKQAVYDPENRGHFGLALVSYTHFTSPIRRYPDLLLHRTIKYLLAKEANILQDNTTPTGGFHYEMPQIRQLGQHCSMTERRADEATRDVIDWLKCDFMQDQVGGIFKGVISSVTGFGFFVRLTDFFIDGLVHVSTLDNDYYRFDSIGQRLIGESSGHTYRLGDTVEVRLDAVHMDERKIDFALISSSKYTQCDKSKSELKHEKRRITKNSGNRRHKMQKGANFKPNTIRYPTEKIADMLKTTVKKKEMRKPLDKSYKIKTIARIKSKKKIHGA